MNTPQYINRIYYLPTYLVPRCLKYWGRRISLTATVGKVIKYNKQLEVVVSIDAERNILSQNGCPLLSVPIPSAINHRLNATSIHVYVCTR